MNGLYEKETKTNLESARESETTEVDEEAVVVVIDALVVVLMAVVILLKQFSACRFQR